MVLQFFFQNVGPGIACDVDFEVIKDSEAGDFGRQPETVELALAKKSYEDTCTRPKNTLRGYEISSRASLKKLVRFKVAQDVRIRRAAETKGSHIKHHSLVYRTAYSLYRRVNTEDSALEGAFSHLSRLLSDAVSHKRQRQGRQAQPRWSDLFAQKLIGLANYEDRKSYGETRIHFVPSLTSRDY